MVYCQAYWLAVIGVVLTVIENGYALRCWKCSSDLDSTCRDYFNTTNIILNQRNMDTYHYGNVRPVGNEPELELCDEMHTTITGPHKNVCLKRVTLVPHGPKQVSRECRLVSRNLKVGTCPEDISDRRNVDFCETCETDSCNSAGRNSLIIASLVPAVIMWLGK